MYVEIPEGVTGIGSGAFSGCSGLNSIKIPEGMTSIGDGVFTKCSSLENIEIPSSVTSIGGAAFINNFNISRILIYCTKGFYAETYAKENKMSYKYIEVIHSRKLKLLLQRILPKLTAINPLT